MNKNVIVTQMLWLANRLHHHDDRAIVVSKQLEDGSWINNILYLNDNENHRFLMLMDGNHLVPPKEPNESFVPFVKEIAYWGVNKIHVGCSSWANQSYYQFIGELTTWYDNDLRYGKPDDKYHLGYIENHTSDQSDISFVKKDACLVATELYLWYRLMSKTEIDISRYWNKLSIWNTPLSALLFKKYPRNILGYDKLEERIMEVINQLSIDEEG